MRCDLYRYPSCAIRFASIRKRVVQSYTNFHISAFTEESRKIIESFVYYAVEIFNESYLRQTASVRKTLLKPEKCWDYDHEEYVWEREIMKNF
jgi:hypothetical protein